MKRTVLLVTVWMAATLAVGAVAMLVVRSAGDRVSEEAVIPLSAREIEALRTTTSAAPLDAGTGAELPVDSTAPAPTTGAPATTEGDPTTTAPDPSTTVLETSTTVYETSTTVLETTTTTSVTTTTAGDTARNTAYTLAGGTVVIRFDGETVSLVSATPNPGYQVEVEARGPDQVAVEFEGQDGSSHFKAEVSGGELVIEREEGD